MRPAASSIQKLAAHLRLRDIALAVLVVAMLSTLAGCGGSSTASTATTSTVVPGVTVAAPLGTPTLRMLLNVQPQSLDPAVDDSTEGAEINWLVYTGLTTYRRASGAAGTQVIAGLATSLPQVSDGGLTYTATLRRGLTYATGRRVVAGDFTHTIERAIKLGWSGSATYLKPLIAGAQAYANGQTGTISGISTDDASGRIVIHLTRPFADFDQVLALPALGLVPGDTPMRAESYSPPPGVGPYVVEYISLGGTIQGTEPGSESFALVVNPRWPSEHVADVPAARADIDVEVQSNIPSNALSVLNDATDIFDWSTPMPNRLLRQVRRLQPHQLQQLQLDGATDYVFMNTTKAPFSKLAAREAVTIALDDEQFMTAGAVSGQVAAGCALLPPALSGHLSGTCSTENGDIARARTLIEAAGEQGQKVTVYSPENSPAGQWMGYYTSVLNQIGLKATLDLIPDASYEDTVGAARKVDPQTGFASWQMALPDAVDFYGRLLDGGSIRATGNSNLSQVDDPHINAAVTTLGGLGDSAAATASWQALERYVTSKAYIAVIGYPTATFYTTPTIELGSGSVSPIYGWNLSALDAPPASD
jgi:peptide/nickel transport system substrate-binding protein